MAGVHRLILGLINKGIIFILKIDSLDVGTQMDDSR